MCTGSRIHARFNLRCAFCFAREVDEEKEGEAHCRQVGSHSNADERTPLQRAHQSA
ncbi:MAG: hypothetical protein RL419_1281, partial [Actinomycetota bacterium]